MNRLLANQISCFILVCRINAIDAFSSLRFENMPATQQQHSITLKGSAEIVAEFFFYGINSILYQRGIYPTEQFQRTAQYGMSLLVTTDNEVTTYVKELLAQVKGWLMNMCIQKLVVVIKCKETNETLEKWQFNIECDKTAKETGKAGAGKDEKDIRKEIGSVLRQITASVSFLPLLDKVCVFDVLVYTDRDLEVPEEWGESNAHFIENSEEVRLRSFNTRIHKVDAMVCYKNND